MSASDDYREKIRAEALATGASDVGFAAASEVDAQFLSQYADWLSRGDNATMEYMERHAALRRHPALLLEGCRTVISLAFPYYTPESYTPERRSEALPAIARYALSRDYHKALRKRLKPLCGFIENNYGGATRTCVDTAPLPERYWALKSGIGRAGMNGCVITERGGSYVFLAEILTTLEIEPDIPQNETCLRCGACVRTCPTKALRADGTIDARRCLSYLTIEHRGLLSPEQQKILASPEGRDTLYGCDRCQQCCPHNRGIAPEVIPDFKPRADIRALTAADIAGMTEQDWDLLTRGSAMRRADFPAMQAHARASLKK